MTVNVLSLLEAEGAADIFMQVVKLSEERRKLPEQVVLSVLVVIVLVDIDSLNVTATLVETAIFVELSSGLTDSTVGAIVSGVDVLSVSETLSLVLSSLAQLLRLNTRIKIIGARKCNDFPRVNIISSKSVEKFIS